MTCSSATLKRVLLVVLLCSLLSLISIFPGVNSSVRSSQKLTRKRVWVLFPMARNAQEIAVEVNEENELIYQDDIIVNPAQIITDPAGTGTKRVDLVLKLRRLQLEQGASGRRAIPFSAGAATWWMNWGRWPDGVIPYKIHPDMPQDKRDLIAIAINNINENTNLCFRKREAGEDDYVEYVPVQNVSYHGMSSLGRVNGRQTIKLNVANASLKTAVHESLHAAGFIHEHSRSDRDQFIRINTEDIVPDKREQFEPDWYSENYTNYDFKSVMHYNKRNFGIEDPDGTRRITMEPWDDDNEIDPSDTVTALDIEGVNSTYPVQGGCNERAKRITLIRVNSDGSLGSQIRNEIVSSGWSDVEPILINGQATHLMFLNPTSDFARVRSLKSDGDFRDEAAYEKEWAAGWEDLEMYDYANTTFILHHKRFPHLNINGIDTNPFAAEQGFTRIAKVQPDAPFEDGTLGERVYEGIWGEGWTSIKFFSAGGMLYLLRYKRGKGTAQVVRILNPEQPFSGRIRNIAYEATWYKKWDIIRLFKIANETYCFFLRTATGRVAIYRMRATGELGELKYEDDWSSGWDNVSFFNHPNGDTYFITIKSSTGKVHYFRFGRNNPFNSRTPFERVLNNTWSKGWTHSKFYRTSNGNMLLLMKQ